MCKLSEVTRNTVKSYRHTVTATEGMHARPAGQFVKLAVDCLSSIEVQKGDKRVNVRRIMSVLQLCIKQGETIDFFVEGEDEESVLEQVRRICQENL